MPWTWSDRGVWLQCFVCKKLWEEELAVSREFRAVVDAQRLAMGRRDSY